MVEQEDESATMKVSEAERIGAERSKPHKFATSNQLKTLFRRRRSSDGVLHYEEFESEENASEEEDDELFKRIQKHKVTQQVIERVSERHNGKIHIHTTNITLDQAHKAERGSGAAEN